MKRIIRWLADVSGVTHEIKTEQIQETGNNPIQEHENKPIKDCTQGCIPGYCLSFKAGYDEKKCDYKGGRKCITRDIRLSKTIPKSNEPTNQ